MNMYQAGVPYHNTIFQFANIHMVENRSALCTAKYPGHPHGCPNHGKRLTCPPNCALIHEHYDITRPLYLLGVKWPIGMWADRMKAAHPNWTKRQQYNCLYWQGKVRKLLKGVCDYWLDDNPEYQIDTCPEAMGLDVDKTMRDHGVVLEWPPREWVWKIAIAGILKVS